MDFGYRSAEKLEYRIDGHYYLSVPTFYTSDNYVNDLIRFIFDTGAFLTVINRDTAAAFGFDKIEAIHKNIPLSGFTGSGSGDLKEIPGMIKGGRRLEGVKVAVDQNHSKAAGDCRFIFSNSRWRRVVCFLYRFQSQSSWPTRGWNTEVCTVPDRRKDFWNARCRLTSLPAG